MVAGQTGSLEVFGSVLGNVRFGSITDIERDRTMSALPPKADIDLIALKSPLWVTGKERAFAHKLAVWRGVDCGIPTACCFIRSVTG